MKIWLKQILTFVSDDAISGRRFGFLKLTTFAINLSQVSLGWHFTVVDVEIVGRLILRLKNWTILVLINLGLA